jgi:putative spermidine/putrescine transport system permease protein
VNRALRAIRIYAIIVAVLMVLPIIIVLLASLNERAAIFTPPKQWGFHWFSVALHDPSVVSSFRFSLVMALIVAVVGTVLGVALGLAVGRYRFPGRRAIYAAVLAPLMIPHVLLAIGLLQFSSTLGLPSSPDGLVIGEILIVLPFVLRIVVIAVSNLNVRLEHASYSLGVSPARTWSRVVLPQLMPGVAAALLLAFLTAFDESVISVFIATPGYTSLPATLIQEYINSSSPEIAVVSAILIVLSLIVVLILDRLVGLLALLSRNNVGTG